MTLKEKIYQHCFDSLSERISAVQSTLNDLKDSASNETKSTAGDKHETALAMLQIEQKNVSAQLENLNVQMQTLKRLAGVNVSTRVIEGSLVLTDKGYYYVTIAAGKVVVDGSPIIVLSAQSPLGRSFIGKEINAVVSFNTTTYTLQEIM